MTKTKTTVNLFTKDKPMKLRSVLIIDNEEIDLFISKRVLVMDDFADNVYTETSVRSALHFLKTTKDIPELILVDLKMDDMDGLDFLNEFQKLPKNINEKCKVVLLSAYINYYDYEVMQIKQHKYSSGVLEKPLNVVELFEMVMANK